MAPIPESLGRGDAGANGFIGVEGTSVLWMCERDMVWRWRCVENRI